MIALFLLLPFAAQAWPWSNTLPSPQPKPERFQDCRSSKDGIAFIALWEGYEPFPYKDVAGYPTIGHGHLIKPGEHFEGPLLPPAAFELLEKDARSTERGINKLIGPPLFQYQCDPVISFSFNLGVGAFKGSTMLRLINAERHAEVPAQFKRWVNAGGKEVKGLVLRRAAEASKYSGE